MIYIKFHITLLILSFEVIFISCLTHMSYVEVNTNSLSNVGCYIRSDNNQPFFQMTSIFAANINGESPDSPVIYFNDQVNDLLTNKYEQITFLKQKGIKVLITLLGNHYNAGWGCMTQESAMRIFAKNIVDMLNKYNLDGVDIDNEYSKCTTNDYSVAKIVKYIKEEQGFAGKIVTKALWSDKLEFNSGKLGQILDFGSEVSYFNEDFSQRLQQYIQYGMKNDQLFLGVWNRNSPRPGNVAKFLIKNNFKGIMIYDVTINSQDYLTQIVQAEFGPSISVEIIDDCLK